MSDVLVELGKKLAEKWLTLLVLPGALYLAVGVTANVLGHTHPFDVLRLSDQVTAWAKVPAAGTFGGQVVVLAAIGAGAAGVGLVAQALGSLVEHLSFAANWRGWPPGGRAWADRATRRRRERWRRRRQLAGSAQARAHIADPNSSGAAEAAAFTAWAEVYRVGSEEPARPTWSGDRVHVAALRLQRDVGVDLGTVWPHLWLMLPDTPRSEITTVRQALTRASTLTAWSVLYLPLVLWWWPALFITTALALTGHHRFRAATEAYATLLEAVVRLHAGDLARQLGLDCTGPLTEADGAGLTDHLTPRRVRPALPSPSSSSGSPN
ncbi:hypothetical protein [Streptomyces sp. BK340]|uniref:hypothetical protein n=1 Tax=Streptomyces sp. BK340 TaxID=2572903 RepID=UPI0011A491B8|nr:hypothetical protein [Streptomyces sp. BK340]TVZ94918.1 hypothetical protein FB157_10421 [Streptomyces sp. BK340]